MGSTLSFALKGILMDEVTKESQNNAYLLVVANMGGSRFGSLKISEE